MYKGILGLKNNNNKGGEYKVNLDKMALTKSENAKAETLSRE